MPPLTALTQGSLTMRERWLTEVAVVAGEVVALVGDRDAEAEAVDVGAVLEPAAVVDVPDPHAAVTRANEATAQGSAMRLSMCVVLGLTGVGLVSGQVEVG